MTIHLLSPQLANQIAAGEVVERPSSVIKELVENSLDAGATQIDVEIEKGGSKLIRIRDNGSGIAKDDLLLALSRHATSKIASLDDLESILSLGFRGEALASISSVSRLTLTSRTKDQEQAWAAIAEGRDMQVDIKPAAHPVGTSIEVEDLFFNTPARRKFLRSDKTEFSHIDEVLRRIALSRFDVAILLKHNGKMLRQYKPAALPSQKEQRLAGVCGKTFVEDALQVSLEHDGLHLEGWVCTPKGARPQSDVQYCYVNGRMMRDKLINHAIRQAYETALETKDYAAYVLFITLDPQQVDVNVHPSKQEVRFHQARLVHDFIYQAIHSALEKGMQLEPNVEWQVPSQPVRESAFSSPLPTSSCVTNSNKERTNAGLNDYRPQSRHPENDRIYYKKVLAVGDDKAHASAIQEPVPHIAPRVQTDRQISGHSSLFTAHSHVLCPLSILQQHYLLLQEDDALFILDLFELDRVIFTQNLLKFLDSSQSAQPLLIPTSLPISDDQLLAVQAHGDWLEKIGIKVTTKANKRLIVHTVPEFLRQQDISLLVSSLLDVLFDNIDMLNTQKSFTQDIIDEFLQQYSITKNEYSLSNSIQELSSLEQLLSGNLKETLVPILKPLSYQSLL